LFAVGAVLYEMLASAKAFESDTVASLLIKIAKTPHVPITDRVPDLPVSLVSLVNRLLAKDRQQRPQSAGEVSAELRGCMLSIAGTSDTVAAAKIGGVVTEQTLAIGGSILSPVSGFPGTPRPPSGRAGAPRDLSKGTPPPSKASASAESTGVPSAAEASNARLASLALQRGRELRKSGDLAGAMQVFRSVLEVAPGNAEALEELQALEADLRRGTAHPPSAEAAETVLRPRVPERPSAPVQLEASPAGAKPAPGTVVPRADTPEANVAIPAAPVAPHAAVSPSAATIIPGRAASPSDASKPAPASAAPVQSRSGSGLAVAAMLLLVIVGAAGGGYYLWHRQRAQQSTGERVTTTTTAPVASAAVTSIPSTSSAVSPTVSASPGAAVESSSSSVPTATAQVVTSAPAAAPEPTSSVAAPSKPAASTNPPPAAENADRVKADAARARLGATRREALSRHPLPPRIRQTLAQTERAARTAYDRGDYVTAAATFDTATRLVETAMNEPPPRTPAPSNAPGSAPSEKPQPQRTEPPPPTPPAQPRTEDAPPVRPPPPRRETSPGDVDTFKRAAPSSVDSMFNASPSAAATVARITDVIERYTKAMEQRDLEAVRSLRTEVTPLEQRTLRQGRQVRYKIDDLNVQPSGAEAVATGRRTFSAEVESGEKLTLSGPVTIRLVRRPAGWLIAEIK
jgi:hypothetical protein